MALQVTFLGHSGFLLASGDTRIAIDPFLTGNPVARHKPADIQVQHICLTHGHADHLGDSLAIARRDNAVVYSVYEIHEYFHEQGYTNTQPGNHGGRIVTDFGYVAFTQAFHSSSDQGRYLGQPAGIVLEIHGVTVYHCGDTGLFGDMKLLGEIYRPQIAMIPVGDRFTMGPELGRMAAEMIRPRVAIPMHYKTFDMLVSDISAFKPAGVQVQVLEPGQTWEYAGG